MRLENRGKLAAASLTTSKSIEQNSKKGLRGSPLSSATMDMLSRSNTELLNVKSQFKTFTKFYKAFHFLYQWKYCSDDEKTALCSICITAVLRDTSGFPFHSPSTSTIIFSKI